MFLLVLLLGVVLAVLWRRLNDANALLTRISAEQRLLRARLESLESARAFPAPPPDHAARSVPVSPVPPLPSDVAGPALPVPPERPPVPPPFPEAGARPSPGPSQPPPPIPPSTLESPAGAARWALEFFTTGNVVAKVGMIIVFFGVAFLLRYAAERGMLPIEYRLMATAVGAAVLVGVGWHLRTSRPEYAVVLQGGAVGVLYLTIFAAFRLYALLPATLTFALLLAVVAFSAVLAVAQNAMSLAVLGTSGGFLAPILASTGSGSHVALFTYYAALNLGVAAIAWFRSWRFLNWIAFIFTFGIGFAWGQQYYRPALLSTTEPFLVFFFLLFVAISVIFAHRQPPQLRGYIDGSLVFGTPAIAFGMQSALVADIPFARAYSAVALSGLYLTLTRVLWRRDQVLRPLAEAFLALAVVFLIVAVPMAFDGHATAAAWALEGAGLIWIGIRQHRRLARVAGVVLLIGGGMAFSVMDTPSVTIPILNTRFLGAAAVAIGSVIGGRLMSRAGSALHAWERPVEWVLLVWGLSWWTGATTVEIDQHVTTRLEPSAFLLAIAGSGLAIGLLARRWQWRAMMLMTLPFTPVAWLVALVMFVTQTNDGPLSNWGWAAWVAVLAMNYALLWWFEAEWPAITVSAWHTGVAWLLMFLTTWSVAVVVRDAVPDSSIWTAVVWCLVPMLFVLALRSPRFSPPWPFTVLPVNSARQPPAASRPEPDSVPQPSAASRPEPDSVHQSPAALRLPFVYSAIIPIAPIAVMLTWTIWACTEAGDPAPLPYVPLLNPLELTQAFTLLVAYGWGCAMLPRIYGTGLTPAAALRPVTAGLVFLTLNAVVGRGVHFFLDVPYDLERLAGSAVFQTGISILWGTMAGLLMTFARRRLDRPVWMAGAALLGVLVLKLFLVDFGNIGGIARIVSFMVTGIVILLIGYFAPAPPRAAAEEQTA